jgi:hypothetical protein
MHHSALQRRHTQLVCLAKCDTQQERHTSCIISILLIVTRAVRRRGIADRLGELVTEEGDCLCGAVRTKHGTSFGKQCVLLELEVSEGDIVLADLLCRVEGELD